MAFIYLCFLPNLRNLRNLRIKKGRLNSFNMNSAALFVSGMTFS